MSEFIKSAAEKKWKREEPGRGRKARAHADALEFATGTNPLSEVGKSTKSTDDIREEMDEWFAKEASGELAKERKAEKAAMEAVEAHKAEARELADLEKAVFGPGNQGAPDREKSVEEIEKDVFSNFSHESLRAKARKARREAEEREAESKTLQQLESEVFDR